MKLSSHLFINANKEKYNTHYANTTGKIKLKGQRKEWFGLLPVFCHKENTHCLNSVVLVYHTGHNNILPKSVPSLSAHRVAVFWNRTFDRSSSSAVFIFYRKLSLGRFVFVFQSPRRNGVAMKVCRVLKMWLVGDSSMNVSGFLSSWKSIQKNTVIQ